MKIKLVPAVNGILWNPKNEILLTKRAESIREGGKWCIPGGRLDPGETLLQGMRREIQEETGLEVCSEELLGVYSDPELTLTPDYYDLDYYGQFIVTVFMVRDWRGEIKLDPKEVQDFGWFNLGNIPSPLVRPRGVRIQDAYQFTGKSFYR